MNNHTTDKNKLLKTKISNDYANGSNSKPKLTRTSKQRKATLKLGQAIVEKLSIKLSAHTSRNTNIDHINHSIYHLLCQPFTFVNAYTKISKNKGALTKGVASDAEINRFYGQSDAINIARKFQNKSFIWSPVRRTMIEKPGKKKKRPIDTPTQENRIAQEAIRGILEAIYEPEFREFSQSTGSRSNNYGFRPKLSTWDAVETFKKTAGGSTHIIEGDIVSAYNSMDHEIFLAILGRRIKDRQFLDTINSMLKSGIMHRNTFIHSLVGTPQGGIASPLFFNIYMFELDKFVFNEIVLPQKLIPSKKTNNPEYKALEHRCRVLLNKYKESKANDKVKDKDLLKSFHQTELARMQVPSRIPETLPKVATYARYADDWALAVTGPEASALHYKDVISNFLKDKLKMELDPVKTLVTRLDTGFDFLGFHIQAWKPFQNKLKLTLKNQHNPDLPTTRYKSRTTSRKITIYPSVTRLHTNLLRNKFCKGEDLTPIAKSGWTLLDEFEIVLKYRQTFVGLVNYYRFCDDINALNRVSYILQYSCAKTIAYRQKITMSQVFDKLGKNLRITRDIVTPKGTKKKAVHFSTLAELRNEGLVTVYYPPNDSYDPFNVKTYWRTKFKQYFCCCICSSGDRVALHHINSLRALRANDKKDQFSYIRSCLNRLQIPVCHSCHLDITNGVYSNKSPVDFYDEFIAKL